eukprot:jgi/Psemu1/27519/gm1.27519_g
MSDAMQGTAFWFFAQQSEGFKSLLRQLRMQRNCNERMERQLNKRSGSVPNAELCSSVRWDPLNLTHGLTVHEIETMKTCLRILGRFHQILNESFPPTPLDSSIGLMIAEPYA